MTQNQPISKWLQWERERPISSGHWLLHKLLLYVSFPSQFSSGNGSVFLYAILVEQTQCGFGELAYQCITKNKNVSRSGRCCERIVHKSEPTVGAQTTFFWGGYGSSYNRRVFLWLEYSMGQDKYGVGVCLGFYDRDTLKSSNLNHWIITLWREHILSPQIAGWCLLVQTYQAFMTLTLLCWYLQLVLQSFDTVQKLLKVSTASCISFLLISASFVLRHETPSVPLSSQVGVEGTQHLAGYLVLQE